MSVSSHNTTPVLERLLSGVTAVSSPAADTSQAEADLALCTTTSIPLLSEFNAGHFLQPWNPRLMKDIMLNSDNFQPQSAIQVLRVNRSGTFWHPGVSDADIGQFLPPRLPSPFARKEHTLLAFFVRLEFNKNAKYLRQASISRGGLAQLVGHIGMHDAAIQDLLGRPDYWSASSRRKGSTTTDSEGYEFFCQHPRWLQVSRHDKTQHRAPCSVYMHHDVKQNSTYYVISTARGDSCTTEILKELDVPNADATFRGASIAAAESPFWLHTLISGYAYNQSTDFLADVRKRLFDEIAKVNDYSEESRPSLPGVIQGKDAAGRRKLEGITKSLHLVSQTCDTGIANADMSISLCKEMLQAYKRFGAIEDAATELDSARQVQDSMEWLLKTWACQRNWLVSYKARKDTAMNFVFNLVTQQDNSLNIDIAHQAAEHSSSMNAITILTMLFLPGTFVSALFGSGIFNHHDTYGISAIFWPFICTVVPLTLVTSGLWFWRRQLESSLRRLRQKLNPGLNRSDLEAGLKAVGEKT